MTLRARSMLLHVNPKREKIVNDWVLLISLITDQ